MGMSHSRTAPMSFKKTSRTTWGHDKRFGGNLCLLPSHCFLSCEPLWGLAEGTDLRKDYSLTSLLLPFQSCDVQRGGGGFCSPRGKQFLETFLVVPTGEESTAGI